MKLAINGMGRIGRTILREWIRRKEKDLTVVAVNIPGNPETCLHLLEFDSVHGPLSPPIRYDREKNRFALGDSPWISFHQGKTPHEIPWGEEVDLVIDATGKFRDGDSLRGHRKGPVKKVIVCSPAKGVDATLVMGVNHQHYKANDHHILSNASCTTNALAPLLKVLHDSFGVERGLMTTVHAYTGDQRLLDKSHKDLRRARAAGLSLIPTSTGAAKTIGEIIPDLKGKLDGLAVRVPTPNVSLVDLTAVLKRSISPKNLHTAFQEACAGNLKGYLKMEERPLVSVDYKGLTESACIDAPLIQVSGPVAKVVAWYDNEVGFSHRVLDLAQWIGGH